MKSRGHHYITEGYQRNFTDNNGHVWVLTSENKIFNTNPENVFKEDYFYVVKIPTGSGSLKVENTLSQIEGEYLSALIKMQNGQELSMEERASVAMFIAAMFDRTKIHRSRMRRFIDQILVRGRAMKSAIDVKRTTGWEPTPLLDSAGDTGFTMREIEDYRKDLDSHHSKSIMRMAIKNAPKIFAMHWTIFETTENVPFITSDNPLFMCSPLREKKFGVNSPGAAAGLKHVDVELSFPLSKTHALLATWNTAIPVHVLATPKQVDQINYRSIRGAKNYIASRRSILDEILSKILTGSQKNTNTVWTIGGL